MRPLPKKAMEFGRGTVTIKPDQVIRMLDGSCHYVEYVNNAGAYAVPLAGINREIQGNVVNFTAGGRTISARSLVEVINPLALGGNSPEYKRYVTMAKRSRATKGKDMAGGETADTELPVQGIGLMDFEGEPEGEADGHAASTGASVTVPSAKDNDMAKKAPKAKAAKREKTPKTVRACVCGCKTETTGYFAPGHDARFHGWIKKLADGRMEPKELPAAVRNGLDLVQTKEGFRAKAPHYYKD